MKDVEDVWTAENHIGSPLVVRPQGIEFSASQLSGLRDTAVLGHWMVGYIHPYPESDSRMARFLMNAMPASGGYLWAVIEVGDRIAYVSSLDHTSIDMNIKLFAEFLAKSLARSMKQIRKTATK